MCVQTPEGALLLQICVGSAGALQRDSMEQEELPTPTKKKMEEEETGKASLQAQVLVITLNTTYYQ